MLTLGEQDVWQCPRCGRGSPDIRDEAAHLDAHRLVERDRALVTWQLLVHRLAPRRATPGERNRGPAPLVVSVLAAILLATLLLSLRAGEPIPRAAKETTSPVTPAPVAGPETPPPSAPSSSGEAPAGQPPAPVPPVNVDPPASPSSPPAISQPLTAGPTPPPATPAEPADRPHLLQLCLPSLCVTV